MIVVRDTGILKTVTYNHTDTISLNKDGLIMIKLKQYNCRISCDAGREYTININNKLYSGACRQRLDNLISMLYVNLRGVSNETSMNTFETIYEAAIDVFKQIVEQLNYSEEVDFLWCIKTNTKDKYIYPTYIGDGCWELDVYNKDLLLNVQLKIEMIGGKLVIRAFDGDITTESLIQNIGTLKANAVNSLDELAQVQDEVYNEIYTHLYAPINIQE